MVCTGINAAWGPCGAPSNPSSPCHHLLASSHRASSSHAACASLHPDTASQAAGARGVQAAVVQRGGSARVIFHAFSMVGWSLYSLLLREMAAAQSSPRMADVCGVVLDSTPDTAVRGAEQQCKCKLSVPNP